MTKYFLRSTVTCTLLAILANCSPRSNAFDVEYIGLGKSEWLADTGEELPTGAQKGWYASRAGGLQYFEEWWRYSCDPKSADAVIATIKLKHAALHSNLDFVYESSSFTLASKNQEINADAPAWWTVSQIRHGLRIEAKQSRGLLIFVDYDTGDIFGASHD